MIRIPNALLVILLLTLLPSIGSGEETGVPPASPPPAEASPGWDEFDDDSWGEEPPQAPAEQVYSLPRCIKLAVGQNREIMASHWEVAYYDAKAGEAWWAWFPQIKVTAMIAPAPRYRFPGTPEEFVNYREGDFKSLQFAGVTYSHQAEMNWPLFTFGKIQAVRDMGPLAQKAGRLQREVVIAKVIFEVRKAYYTLQMAERMISVLDDGLEQVESAQKTLENLLKSGSGSVTEIDRYKLSIARSELLARREEARYGRDVAFHALLMLTNQSPPPGEFWLDSRYSRPPEGTFAGRSYEDLLETMFRQRPEVALLDVRLEMERLEEKRQWGAFFPDFVFGIRYSYSVSPTVEDAHNPYVYDPYNSHYIVGWLGFQYRFDLPGQIYRDRAANARLEREREQRENLRSQMALQLREAMASLTQRTGELTINRQAKKQGKQWMVSQVMNYEAGLVETGAVVEAISAYFKGQFMFAASMHAANLAEAKMIWVTGSEAGRYGPSATAAP